MGTSPGSGAQCREAVARGVGSRRRDPGGRVTGSCPRLGRGLGSRREGRGSQVPGAPFVPPSPPQAGGHVLRSVTLHLQLGGGLQARMPTGAGQVAWMDGAGRDTFFWQGHTPHVERTGRASPPPDTCFPGAHRRGRVSPASTVVFRESASALSEVQTCLWNFIALT